MATRRWRPAPETPLNVRSNQLYARLIETGWLQEERRGYHVFVSMPHTASQLAAALVEIAEGRPLIMSGKLKAIRAAVHSVVDDPTNNADALVEFEKDSVRFARHLRGIRGAIKILYDEIRTQTSAREVIGRFFDDFLEEILIRDYTPNG